jgi:signal peptidase I
VDTLEETIHADGPDGADARVADGARERPLIPAARGLQTAWPREGVSGPLERRTPLGFLRELPVLIVVAFTLAVLMKTFLVQAFFIPSESMVPTLLVGDRVLVNKLAFRFREPTRGEVIVFVAVHGKEDHSFFGRIKHFVGEGVGLFKAPETDFIKRIIGLPGETIQVTSSGVLITPVHGKRFKLREPYVFDPNETGPLFGPYKVPAGKLFVMGDNRANSSDSRFSGGPIYGGVRRGDVIGKAFVRIWPPKRMGLLHEPCYPQRAPRVVCPPVSASKGTPLSVRARSPGGAVPSGAVPSGAVPSGSVPLGAGLFGAVSVVAAAGTVRFGAYERRAARRR